MKFLVILALCFGAVFADQLHNTRDFRSQHYTRHEQTVADAKKNLGVTLDGDYDTQKATSFEEVGAYGGGVVDSGASFDSSSTFGASAGCLTNCLQKSMSEQQQRLLSQFQQRPLIHHFPSTSGSTAGSQSYTQHSERTSVSQPQTISYTLPAAHSENYVRVEEQKTIAQPQVVQVVQPAVGGSERYVKIKKVTTTSSQPQYTVVPSGSLTINSQRTADYTTSGNTGVLGGLTAFEHLNAGQFGTASTSNTQQASSLLAGSSGFTGGNSHYGTNQYGTTGQYVAGSTGHFGSTNSLQKIMTEAEQLAKLQTHGSGLNAGYTNAGYNSGYNSGLTSSTGYTGGLASSTGYNSGLTSSTGYTGGLASSTGYNSGLTSSTGYNSGLTSSTGYNSGLTSSTGYTGGLASSTGYTGGLASSTGYNSGLASSTGYNSGSLTSGYNSGLTSSTGYTGGLSSGYTDGLSSSNAYNSDLTASSGFKGGFGANLDAVAGNSGTASGFGNAGSGYQAKSWEKSSKWSSQSGVGADGKVSNYNDLVTGQSENFNVNGKTGGYHAATATVDDNGKVSTYSLHS